MRILTNARRWKQTAYGLVEVSYNKDKDLLRAKLELITKNFTYANALSNARTTSGGVFVVVPTEADCSTPEQIIARAIEIWKTDPDNAAQIDKTASKR